MQKPKMILVEKVSDPGAGRTKEISATTWDLWRNHVERAEVRKGYRFVKELEPGEKSSREAMAARAAPTASFEPPELKKGNASPEAGLTEEEAAEAPVPPHSAPPQPPVIQPVPQPKPTAPVVPPAAPAPTGPTPKRDNFLQIQGMGNKVQEALYAAGINTYEDLIGAEAEKVAAVLDSISMAPKKAQVPRWKEEAKKLLNPIQAGIRTQ